MRLFLVVPLGFLILSMPVARAQGGPEQGPETHWKRMLERFDLNRDGVIEQEEFKGPGERFNRMDRNQNGKIDASDMRPASSRPGSGRSDLRKGGRVRKNTGPGVGTVAPDFTLKDLDGKQTVTLSKAVAERPVVLTFGSYTCPPFRKAVQGMEDVYQAFKDKLDFYFVYIKEAHPSDGRVSSRNGRGNLKVVQPEDYAAREEIAATCQRALDLTMPILVDDMDNAVDSIYSGWPNRVFIIDQGGTVVYKGPRGPSGTQPDAVTRAIEELLAKK